MNSIELRRVIVRLENRDTVSTCAILLELA
jgi:hypothetical protein